MPKFFKISNSKWKKERKWFYFFLFTKLFFIYKTHSKYYPSFLYEKNCFFFKSVDFGINSFRKISLFFFFFENSVVRFATMSTKSDISLSGGEVFGRFYNPSPEISKFWSIFETWTQNIFWRNKSNFVV